MLVLALGIPYAVRAEVKLTASGAVQYEYNSNIYDLESGAPIPGTTNTRHGDESLTYLGTLKLSDLWRQQNVFLNLSGSELRFNHFPTLNHAEYSLDGGWKWKLGLDLSGTLEVTRSHTMLPFSYLLQKQQQLVLETEQREAAAVNFLLNPDWRIETSAYDRTVDAPLPGATGLNLRETSGTAVLRYLRNAKLTGGVGVNYLTGEYGDVIADIPPTYHQSSVFLTASYAVTGHATADAQLGYTRRASSFGADKLSGLTGSLDYKRSLTGKTSVNVFINRLETSNITSSGSEIDSVAGALVSWQATYKLGVSGGYTFTKRFLPDQGLVPGTNRIDHLQSAILNINYQWLRWLIIKPYANVQTRSSDAAGNGFNATVFGIMVTGQWQD